MRITRDHWHGSPREPTQQDRAFLKYLLEGIRKKREAPPVKPAHRQVKMNNIHMTNKELLI